jgi:hypothetical protein
MSIHRMYVRCYCVDIQLTLFNQVKNPLSAVAGLAAGANDDRSTKYDSPATSTPTIMEISPGLHVRLACLCHRHCVLTN